MADQSERFESVEIYYDEVKRETDKAKLFEIDNEEYWIPESQIRKLENNLFTIPRWLAEEKGLV
jgi:hypothetical protein